MNDLTKTSISELFSMGSVQVYGDKHFVYTSKKHGPGYANLRPLGEEANLPVLRELSYRLVIKAIEQAGMNLSQPIVVVGPETLGAVIAKQGVDAYNERHRTGARLRSGAFLHDKEIPEKFLWGPGGGGALMGFNAQVIWVDDLLNEGSTFRRTRHLLEDIWPGSIRAVATIANRSAETIESLDVPHLVYLEKIPLDSYEASVCPLCADKVPVVRKPGHGHVYEQERPDYPGGFENL